VRHPVERCSNAFRYVELAIVRSLVRSRARASEPLVDIARTRGETRLFLLCVFAVRDSLTVYHRDVTRELASARISRARCHLYLSALSPAARYPYISLSGAVSRAYSREAPRERERVNASTRLREGCPREQGATVRVLPNLGKITA